MSEALFCNQRVNCIALLCSDHDSHQRKRMYVDPTTPAVGSSSIPLAPNSGRREEGVISLSPSSGKESLAFFRKELSKFWRAVWQALKSETTFMVQIKILMFKVALRFWAKVREHLSKP